MRDNKIWLVLGLIFNLVINFVPVAAQLITSLETRVETPPINQVSEQAEAFRGLRNSSGISSGWRGKIVYETRYQSGAENDKTTDTFSKIIEITMTGSSARAATAQTEISGRRTDEIEARQKKCCRSSGGLGGRCAAETVQTTKYQTIVVSGGRGTAEILGFINIRDGRYSIEFSVPGIRSTTKTTTITTLSGMCNPADNKTETGEFSAEIELPPTLVKASGEVSAKTPRTLKGELQLDRNTRISWELTRTETRP